MNKIKKVLLVVSIILANLVFNFLGFTNNVYAVELGENGNLFKIADCETLLTYKGSQIITTYVGYNDGTVKNCRLIEHDKLQLVLNDYCNKADDEYPVVSLVSNTNKDTVAKLYVENNSNVNLLTCNYICNPAKVQNNSNPIDCDLPEYLHNEIVELAVNKYFQSVGSTTQSVKQ